MSARAVSQGRQSGNANWTSVAFRCRNRSRSMLCVKKLGWVSVWLIAFWLGPLPAHASAPLPAASPPGQPETANQRLSTAPSTGSAARAATPPVHQGNLPAPGGPLSNPSKPSSWTGSELWEAVQIEQQHVGWRHLRFLPARLGSADAVETTIELELSLRRSGAPVTIRQTHAYHETVDGQLLGFVLHEQVGPTQAVIRRGRVEGGLLRWTVQWSGQEAREKTAVVPPRLRGPWGQTLELKAGPDLGRSGPHWQRFEPIFDTILPVDVGWQAEEEVDLLAGRRQRLRPVLLRLVGVDDAPEAVEQLWLDHHGEVIKRVQRHSSLGQVTFLRTTEAKARQLVSRSFALDIGRQQLIRLKKPIADFNNRAELTYLIRWQPGQPSLKMPQADRQWVKELGPGEVEVRVIGLETPPDAGPSRFNPPAEYLLSNRFINSADPLVQRYAQQATRGLVQPWTKAVAIERWVHQQLRGKPGSSEGYAQADEVARRLAGDCKAHAILAAAMCRAVGVPARTAAGLVYVPREQALGFHLWLEVWVDGRWYALDPTLGQGRVGAGHLKLADQHWNGAESLAPLQPVLNMIGRLEVSVRE